MRGCLIPFAIALMLPLAACNGGMVASDAPKGAGPFETSSIPSLAEEEDRQASAALDAADAGRQERRAVAPQITARTSVGRATGASGQARPLARKLSLGDVSGATDTAARPLRQGLEAAAAAKGITFVAGGASDALSMKGYFSAIAEGNVTTIIYVWDVLDASGTRVHRIQGQDKAGGTNGEGWSAVSDADMRRVAERTIADLSTWMSERPG